MTDRIWKQLVPHLPRNLTIAQVCDVFRRSRTRVSRQLKAAGYKPRPAAVQKVPGWVSEADWNRPNAEIARQYGLSRERVRQYRKILGKKFVEGRGRKPKGEVYHAA